MKYIKYLAVVILALLMVSFTSPGERKNPTLPPQNLFGHVHWIQSVSYQAIMTGDSIKKGAIINDTDFHDQMIYGRPLRRNFKEPPIEAWVYDEYGDQLEHDKYHANNELYNKITHSYYPNGDVKEIVDSGSNTAKRIWKYTYKYDNSGNMLDSTEYYYAGNSKMPLYSRRVNLYNASGKLLQGLTFYNDTLTPSGLTLYRYNEKGQLTEIDGSRIIGGNPRDLLPTEKNNFWYDKQGRITDKATYRFHQGLVKDIKTTFDTSGYRVETYSYTGNKILTGSVVKSFFKSTNTLQEDIYNANGMLTDYTISHLDPDKHLIDEGTFHINYHSTIGRKDKNDTVMVHHLVNDDHYNVVEDDHFSNDGKTIMHKSYQYTYDKTGNWTAKIYFENNKPVKITERQIGYFQD